MKKQERTVPGAAAPDRKKKAAANIILGAALLLMAAAAAILLWRQADFAGQKEAERDVYGMYDPSATPRPSATPETVRRKVTSAFLPPPTPTPPPAPLPAFYALLEQNPDTVGWLKIDGTDINHVIMQGDDNIFYLDHDFFLAKRTAGCMTLDFRNDIDEIRGHYIIYGHHMRVGKMLNDIMKYKSESFFKDHPTIEFDTIYQSMEWEIFSVYYQRYDFYNTRLEFESDEEWYQYLRALKEESLYETDVDVQRGDVVLTLYSCTYEFKDARFVVHARLKTHEEPSQKPQ